MAIGVTLLSFNKRENSTLRPTTGQIEAGTELDCLLLDDTSLMNPTFKFSLSGNPVGFNYCVVPSFERYFFINDWTYAQGFWYAACTCDVLASWKTEIGTGSHYVLRSASAYDGYISDSFYPAKIKETGIKQVAPNPMGWALGHSYVVGIVGYAPNQYSQFGSVTYYHMDTDALLAFVTYLMTNVDNWSDLSLEYSPGVQQALINPMQYIVSCICVPVPAPSGSVTSLNFGYYTWPSPQGNITALQQPYAIDTDTTINLTPHPQAATRGEYMNCSPFTEHILHYGPFGDIPLDPAALIDCTSITIEHMIDLVTGMARIIVYGTERASNIIYNGTAKVGVDVNLSQTLKDPLAFTGNAVSGTIDLVSAIANGNPGAAAQSAWNTIENGTRLKYPHVSGIGNGGSYLGYFDIDNIYLISKFLEAVDEDITENGRPLCQVKVINTLSGYAVCQNAECIISGTHDEAEKINGYLNSGFFWE